MQKIISAAAILLPLAAAAPTGFVPRDDNPGCSAASFDLTWTVENFVYNASYLFTTPAHQNSWGYANFDLVNPALTYKATCSGTSSQLSDFFYGTVNYACTVPEGNEGTETTFAFDYPGRTLDVNQTWSCSDSDPQYPTTFRAKGTLDLDLDCSDTGTVVNPNWEFGTGSFYSTRYVSCKPVNSPLKPKEMTAVA